jgi:hypothetical protein
VEALSDRLSQIETERLRLYQEIERGLEKGEVQQVTPLLRRLFALDRYAQRCSSNLRKRSRDSPAKADFDRTNPIWLLDYLIAGSRCMKRLRIWRRWFKRRFGYARLACVALLIGIAALRVLDPLPVEELRVRTFDIF